MTIGNWHEYNYEDVINEIRKRSELNEGKVNAWFENIKKQFELIKETIVPILDTMHHLFPDETINKLRKEVEDIEPYISRKLFIEAIRPTGNFISHDAIALQEGFKVPPHKSFNAIALEIASTSKQCNIFSKLLNRIVSYIENISRKRGQIMSQENKRIFIGHGNSLLWLELKDFINDKLELPWDEFNKEPTAGKSNKERLEQMLDEAMFAFIIMTAEDEHMDSTKHARENVIHELGLFQGRLTFNKAIILLENGCSSFTNIEGITQIRFPKNKIKAAFEEIREVLERENIIKK